MTLDFSDIAPYRDHEVPQAIRALLEELSFIKVLRYVYPDLSAKEIDALCKDIQTVREFQSKIAYPAMKLMAEKTISDMSVTGIDDLHSDEASLYISNHRDIILDSALLNMKLHESEYETTETAIGSNLLKDPTVRHLTKLNKNFTVTRDVARKELYDTSLKLSSYIRHAVTARQTSIWISQREGRAKDGNDLTQQGLLKMLAMSSGDDLIAGFKALRIRPLALSYEYDPCDSYKLKELVKTASGETHVKEEDEDLMNIVAGIAQNKGRVHLAIGPLLSEELDSVDRDIPVNDQIMQIAQIIDRHIYRQAHLFPNNYVAIDRMSGAQDHAQHYTSDDVETFLKYTDAILDAVDATDRSVAEGILLQKYAYPVQNKLEALEAIE